MFDIIKDADNKIKFIGQFMATDIERAENYLNEINQTSKLDLSELKYISSAGLSVLLRAQTRLKKMGYELILCNLNKTASAIFRTVGFEALFKIE
ncbi:MAG TPA: STAS domain-containing protein [Melioribacteraceae bacterium]|nr:STAS domain-containing protein [Melioribacteraceae bacterium]